MFKVKHPLLTLAVLMPIAAMAEQVRLNHFHAGEVAEAEKINENFRVLTAKAISAAQTVDELEKTVNSMDSRLTAIEQRMGGRKDVSGKCYHGSNQISRVEIVYPKDQPERRDTAVGTSERAMAFYSNGTGEFAEIQTTINSRFVPYRHETYGPIDGAAYVYKHGAFQWTQDGESQITVTLDPETTGQFYVSGGADVLVGSATSVTDVPFTAGEPGPDEGDRKRGEASQTVLIADNCELVARTMARIKDEKAAAEAR